MPHRLEDIHHIGIAVKDLEEAKKIYCEVLGLEYNGEMALPERGVKVAFLVTGNTSIELIEGTEEDSPVTKFVERHGPGIHHICFEVDDIKNVLKELAETGMRLIDSEPRPGAEGKLVAFIHPKSTTGVLIELTEK